MGHGESQACRKGCGMSGRERERETCAKAQDLQILRVAICRDNELLETPVFSVYLYFTSPPRISITVQIL